ncbi:MAG: hypothetical protein IIX36_05960 [Clostridia bacterium]|nr:hypothetical protein [Clostridia bacterium]
MLNRLKSFLQGRYGNDQLNIFLIILGCVISLFLTLFIPSRLYPVRSLGSLIYLVALLRALSRNFPQRQKENAKFLEISEPWRKYLYKKYNQYQDKGHRYFNCPQCHRTLRVPAGRGKINITCPHCNRQFKKRT